MECAAPFMIKAVFFDVGHTLIYPAAPLAETISHTLATYGYRIAPERISTAMGAGDREHEARYHTLSDDWAQHDTIVALWLRYYQRLFRALSITDTNDVIAHELITWYGQPEAWQTFPDVLPTLEHLRSRGLRLGAVSDWAPTLFRILHGHDLTRYFEFVLCSGNIGFCKPSAHFYRLALQRADVDPRNVLHVGDSYHADVRGARAAGITPVLLDRNGTAPPVDCQVIRDLCEIEILVGGEPEPQAAP